MDVVVAVVADEGGDVGVGLFRSPNTSRQPQALRLSHLAWPSRW